jgi:hypothetical protein
MPFYPLKTGPNPRITRIFADEPARHLCCDPALRESGCWPRDLLLRKLVHGDLDGLKSSHPWSPRRPPRNNENAGPVVPLASRRPALSASADAVRRGDPAGGHRGDRTATVSMAATNRRFYLDRPKRGQTGRLLLEERGSSWHLVHRGLPCSHHRPRHTAWLRPDRGDPDVTAARSDTRSSGNQLHFYGSPTTRELTLDQQATGSEQR